ncbi:MAG TPA: nickel pincer cofactor biosynthesis protein LarC [Acidimicrobiales bacterium]|nr:nickel pincer cofactor biosynthesis protein LarC [Acidimicrobiales bacterium]
MSAGHRGDAPTVAWWHCFSGIAGDMALASLVDAGADLAEVVAALRGLPIRGWEVEAEPVLRGGVAATRLHVHVRDDEVVRTHAHIAGLIEAAALPERARRRALATFAALAEVEGRLHRRPVQQVHFHEVGGHDAIVDVVGTCLALELLGVDRVHASPVAQGGGMVRSAHGLLPVPVPAVVELLRGAPTYGTDVVGELTTPTGAALLAATVEQWGPMPALTVRATGHGAGARELDGRPNVVQVVVGEAAAGGPGPGQPVHLLEANLDDVTGEVLATTIAALMAAGAHDAWVTPVVGKKGRPAHVVSALVDPGREQPVRERLQAETGTLGVRRSVLERWVSPRSFEDVEVGGHVVRVKRSPGRVKAEHDDAARVAALVDLPVREVARRAEEQAWRRSGPPDGAAG